jgi:hypothetical protein
MRPPRPPRPLRLLDRDLVEWGQFVPELALTAEFSLALWVRLLASAAARDLLTPEEPAHDEAGRGAR